VGRRLDQTGDADGERPTRSQLSGKSASRERGPHWKVTTAIDDRRYAFLDVDANVLIGDDEFILHCVSKSQLSHA
jgi:hypothetical protein